MGGKTKAENKPRIKPYKVTPKEIYAEPKPCHPPKPEKEES